MSETALPPRTHNNPPVTPPTPEALSDDLKSRFHELESRLDEFVKAFATYPKKLSLKDEDVAASLQDLLGQVKKHRTLLSAYKKDEKKPWDDLVKVVQNFFQKYDDKTKELQEAWKPVHDDYVVLRDNEARRKAEEEAERQRQIAEEARARAEQAERERQEAEARAAEERRKEQEAREAAERAQREREAAEARAAAAREEERRLADAKRARDREEKDRNADSLKQIRRDMKNAERLNILADAEELDADETAALDQLIKHGGDIAKLAGPVANSTLLDDEQKAEVETIRDRLNELRDAMNARFNKREQKRRQKEAEAQHARDAAAAEQRRKEQAEHDARLAEATRKRQEEEAAAAAANAEKKAAELAARTARAEIKGADKDLKVAARDIKSSTQEADRASNRADRTDRRLEDSNIADPLRGELGTTGSRTKSWKHYVTDEDALKEVIRGSLRRDKATAAYAELFNYMETNAFSEVLNGAVFRYMQAHQGEWHNRTRVDDALAGCLFACEDGSRIG